MLLLGLATESKQSLAVGKELVNLGYFSADSGTGGIYLKVAVRKNHKWVWFQSLQIQLMLDVFSENLESHQLGSYSPLFSSLSKSLWFGTPWCIQWRYNFGSICLLRVEERGQTWNKVMSLLITVLLTSIVNNLQTPVFFTLISQSETCKVQHR